MATRHEEDDAHEGGHPGTGELDWAHAADFLARRLRRLLPPASADDAADLAQEALIDLVRTHRAGPVRNLDALLTTLARRKVIDHVRRRARWRALVEPVAANGEPDPHAEVAPPHGEPEERLRFVVRELFARAGSGCDALARAYFAGYSWAEVAAAEHRAETAVRKQWSRCVTLLRRTLRDRPATLWAWASGRGGCDGDPE